MDSISQREMFVELKDGLRQKFDLPVSNLKWVKCRKNLQVACFDSRPYKWEEELVRKGIKFTPAWTLMPHLYKERTEFCAVYCEQRMQEKLEAMFFCSGNGQMKENAGQYRFIAPVYKNSVCGPPDGDKSRETAMARTMATAISDKIGRGPKQMQAYLFGPKVIAYYWSGLLSVLEKDFMQFKQDSLELEIRFKNMLADCVREVHHDMGPPATITFSDNIFSDQGLILIISDDI
jgi:hypothetical protein